MKRVATQTKRDFSWLIEQFKRGHLKEKETLEGKTRYGKKRKKHVPVVTHVNFVAKALTTFYSDLSETK